MSTVLSNTPHLALKSIYRDPNMSSVGNGQPEIEPKRIILIESSTDCEWLFAVCMRAWSCWWKRSKASEFEKISEAEAQTILTEENHYTCGDIVDRIPREALAHTTRDGFHWIHLNPSSNKKISRVFRQAAVCLNLLHANKVTSHQQMTGIGNVQISTRSCRE